ncbi:MAG: glycosyltransferase [Spirochaetales bacterium]|nr:glycosyltransferase [Spirochaetales bacterium]
MPKVSVITTVYNGEPYFERALPSIQNQTYNDFEYVLVNDGSSDSTGKLLEQTAQNDSRLRVFHTERLGRTKALNYALQQASGEYIIQQDFDDLSYPERIKKQAAFLDQHPEVGLVGTYYVLDDRRRNEKYIRKFPETHEELLRAMAKSIPFAHTMVAYRKEAMKEVGYYVEADDFEDYRTWINMGKLGWQFATIPEVLGEHVVFEESFWHRTYSYKERQKNLANVQHLAIKELDLPFWMAIYPFGRKIYLSIPNRLKRFVRRRIVKTNEEDI